MNCLCCGKALRAPSPSGWHSACVRRFFGTNQLPAVHVDARSLERLALESTSRGYTVPGVQKKLSLHLCDEKKPRLTIVDHPTGYILKPQVAEFEALPEAEQLAMTMAERAGIAAVPHALIDVDGAYAYITRRIDRAPGADGRMKRLAMEDFCQLDLRLTQDKYRGSYERCARLITRHSSRSGLDLTELLMRLTFSFMTGNSDMHLKNLSLIETDEDSRRYVLSPAYDLLPVNLVMPEDQEQLALTLNGRKARLRRADFLTFAAAVGVPEKAALNIIDRMLKMLPEFERLCAQSLLPEGMKRGMSALMSERAATLTA